MKRKTKQFFAAALAACILGAASVPAAAATDSTKSSPGNESFFEQVQNVISDYWQDDYDTEICFTAGKVGAQVDGKTVGNQIGCEVTQDGDFLISAQTFADVTGEAFSLQEDTVKDENSEPADSKFQTMRLAVQSPETPILGSEYGAVQTIEDSSGLYILQFESAEDTQTAYEMFSSMEDVELIEDEPTTEETPENPDDILLPADTIAEEFGYEIVSQDKDSITFTKSFQTMRLIVDSPKHTIDGLEYGAVKTIGDGHGIYVLQFDSVEDLQQLANGNFQITAKKAGTTYIVFEINNCHASLRVDVKDGAIAGGAATRNTSYWGFSTYTQPVRFTAQSHYYPKADGSWNEQAIIQEMIGIGEQMGMMYTPTLTIEKSGYNPANVMGVSGDRSGSDYLQTGFGKWIDYDSFYLQRHAFDAIKLLSSDLRASSRNGHEHNLRFRPYIAKDSRTGETLLYVLYG